MDKYRIYKEWLIKGGAKISAIEYPVAFGPNGVLTGIAAAKDIQPGDLLVEMPESLTFNRVTVLKSEIGHLVKKHPEVFDRHEEVDQSLIIYAFYEKLKGESSFWKPAFDIINLSHLPAFWTQEEIDEFQDPVMLSRIKKYRETYEGDWKNLHKVFGENKYDEYFPGISDPSKEKELKAIYEWCFVAITTRFLQPEFHLELGVFLPFFDCINHKHNNDSLFKLVGMNGEIVRETSFKSTGPGELWGLTEFDYHYSQI